MEADNLKLKQYRIKKRREKEKKMAAVSTLIGNVCAHRDEDFKVAWCTDVNDLQARKAAEDTLEGQKLVFLSRRAETDKRLAARDVALRKEMAKREKKKQAKARQQAELFKMQDRRRREKVREILKHKRVKAQRQENQQRRLANERGENNWHGLGLYVWKLIFSAPGAVSNAHHQNPSIFCV